MIGKLSCAGDTEVDGATSADQNCEQGPAMFRAHHSRRQYQWRARNRAHTRLDGVVERGAYPLRTTSAGPDGNGAATVDRQSPDGRPRAWHACGRAEHWVSCVTGGGTDASLGAKAMTREDLLLRISVDPNVCFGKPCVRGHRIWVSLILDLLASGSTTREIVDDYPG